MLGAGIGFSNAVEELPLVVFTTLGPGAAFAYAVMAVVAETGSLGSEGSRKLRKALALPLVVCMAGLVASATHLGTPSNALYVLSRVGASPLSNEVFSAGVFLFFSAVYWIAGFATVYKKALDKALVFLVCLTGAVFIAMMSLAYDVQTIQTWRDPLFVVTIALSSLVAGPFLADACICSVDERFRLSKASLVLLTVGTAASVAWVIVQCLVFGDLQGMRNSVFGALDLAPGFVQAIVVAAALVLASAVCGWMSRRKGCDHPTRALACACVLSFIGIFVMKFAFYAAHMTVGISL